MTRRLGAGRPTWLGAVVALLIVADFVSGVPTRVLPDRHHSRNDASLDSQSLSASILLQEHELIGSHQHSRTSSQHTAASEELDFSLLNSLIPAASHAELRKRKADTLTEDDLDWHHATSSLLEVNERAKTEASTAAKARTEAAEDLRMGSLNFAKAGTAATLGGMRVQEVDSVTDKAVRSALRLVGFDRPIEDEQPLNLYGDTISERNFDQRDTLLGHDHRPSGSADPAYMDPLAGLSEAALLERAAAARQHLRDAQSGDLAFAELEARIDRKTRDRSNTQHLAPSADQRASTPPAPGATILTEERASTGVPAALAPTAEQGAAGKMPSRGGKQPSSAELLNFLKEHLPSTSMIHPGANFRFRSKHEARAGEDGGDEGGGDGGLAYKPSPFKHPPPPPVPPPPPPPPPPNFGPGSQFSGYSFGGEGGGGEGGGGGDDGGGGGGDDGGGDAFASVYERARMRDPAAAQRAAEAEQHMANGPQELGISMLEVDSKQQQQQQAASDPYSAHRAHDLEAEFAHFPTSGFNEEYFDANYDHWQHAYGYQYPPYYQALHEQYAAYFQQYGQPPHWDAYGGQFAEDPHPQAQQQPRPQSEEAAPQQGSDPLLEDYERAAHNAFASAEARNSV